jgi:hypothetical protein
MSSGFDPDQLAQWKAIAQAAEGKFIVQGMDDGNKQFSLHEADYDETEENIVNIQKANLKAVDMEYHFGRPVLGKILILPEEAAVQFTYPKPWAAISIYSNGDPPELRKENRIGYLRMKFADIEQPEFEAAFTQEQAKKIAFFTEKVWSKVKLLMVHCYAGVSRSPAIGKAISEVYQPNYAMFFDRLYAPNALVYKVLKEELQ